MRTGPVLLAMAVLLALAGCTQADSHVTDAPSASATPVFASDAEALAAAEKAYAAYLQVSDEIAHDGGTNPDRLRKVATGQLVRDDLEGFKTFVARGWHSTGASTVVGFKLQAADLKALPSASSVVSTYVCEDISGVDVLDADGISVVADSRPNLQVFEVAFDLTGTELLPSDRQPWTGSNPCV